MARSVDAIVNPILLIWARNESGLSVEDAAKKVNVKPERLSDWESGTRKPTVIQLRKLANAYKRPLAVFYLPKPPQGFEPLKDYRHLPGGVSSEESPQLRYEVRQANYRRQIAIELYEAIIGPPPDLSLEARIDEDPEGLAERIRGELSIRYEDQITWRTQGIYGPLNHWRAILETAGVLVFQAEKVRVEEMRGFSIGENPLPAIILNVKDSPVARVFTLLHELTHIMLQDRGLCNLREEEKLPPEERTVEVFCNRVAGATLVPRDFLLQESIVRRKGMQLEWFDDEIRSLAFRYGVTREVILRRLLICGRTTTAFYKEKRKELYRADDRDNSEKKERGWGPPPYRRAISSAGEFFVRLVIDNYRQEKITLSDVSGYLGVRLKHLDKIEAAVMG